MNYKKWIVTIGLSFFIVGVNAQGPSWRLAKETDDMKVYYRTVPESNINEVKITTTFNASMSTIVSVLTDVNDYPKWVYKASESNIVNRISPFEMNYYNKLDFPWPLSDRDIVVHSRISQDAKTKVVYSISEANSKLLPLKKDLVRMKEFKSKWTFTPKGASVLGEYEFTSNPAGNIPTWMINLALDEGPVRTIQNFKKLILESKESSKNKLAILN
jgi:hypothetical protein